MCSLLETKQKHSKVPVYFAAAAIVLGAVVAYSNTFRVPFLFDDLESITLNPTIRHLNRIGQVLLPPGRYAAVQRRPVVNLSLAINYAISRYNVWSYHALNLAAHAAAALLLFGIIRRTLLLPKMQKRFDVAATTLAAAAALIWAVHPLLTDAVTYIVQRTEVLAGMFYLLTLYAAIRGFESRRPAYWYAASVAACALAMGCKESAISAPLTVVVYDLAFLTSAGSRRETMRRRTVLYAGLAACWLIVLIMLPHGAEGTDVFGNEATRLDYALAQPAVIANYLKLCFWPNPLVLDYGACAKQSIAGAAPYILFIGGLFVASIVALKYRPWLGFLGFSFFAILAPSSSVVPLVQQVAGEKRMYLPLAAVVVAVVMGLYFAGKMLGECGLARPKTLRIAGVSLAVAVAIVFCFLTLRRNADYRSDLSIWTDTAEKKPQNIRARHNYAMALTNATRFDEAAIEFHKVLKAAPTYALAYNNLGNLYVRRGQFRKAIACYQMALAKDATLESAHNHLGNVLASLGHFDEAVDHYEKALRIKPENEVTYGNLGAAMASRGQTNDAIFFLQEAVRLNPDFADAHNNLGQALMTQGRADDAIGHFHKAVELAPGNKSAQANLNRAMTEKAGKKPTETAP